MRKEVYTNGPMQAQISGVEDDMGEPVTMDAVVEQDGDIVIQLRNSSDGLTLAINLNTVMGGTHNPGVATAFRRAILEIATGESQPDSLFR